MKTSACRGGTLKTNQTRCIVTDVLICADVYGINEHNKTFTEDQLVNFEKMVSSCFV